MRGIGLTFSRLPAARAFFAGVAFLAGASAVKAHAQSLAGTDDTALAVPRVSPRGSAGLALPQPLAPSEAARLRRLFSLQSRGDIATATRETPGLDTDTPLGAAMLGHLLADRYLGRHMKANAGQLRDWLGRWSDLPDARAVHGLLGLRQPRGQALPALPHALTLAATAEEDAAAPVPEETQGPSRTVARNRALDRSVRDAARAGNAAAVSRLLARTPGLSPGYASLLLGEAAQILFTLNRDQDAYDLGRRGATPGTADTAAIAGYAAGLAAWRLDRPSQAGEMFEAAWHAEIATAAQRAAAAFWAGRVRLTARDPAGWYAWLHRAADEKRTFYGLLASRILGLDIGFTPGGREVLGEADLAAVAATAEGLRAFALLQIGQPTRAEAELRLLWPTAQSHPPLARAVMLVAERANLPDLAAQLADVVQAADGRVRDTTRFPIPRLRPAGGFTADPALIYGLARVESNFDSTSVSGAGARGIMQIMPRTARFVADAAGGGRIELDDPAVNLAIGQRYIGHLAGLETVGGDLIRLLASYNAGPGNLGRWGPAIADRGDPLLFIEAVPVDETRAFIPRVLTYSWIYAARLRLPGPGLDDLAAGLWPRYRAPVQVASTLH